ncbi:hypothetical protein SPF06_08945 [Sinomonas sp. JGH33]|uniref:Uncharacterized protein n=1 Tax=Sinomonas terricola TaxID=3110330 RepID=A0ABU5T5A3_9MICC|nr:hypothetical protein [Sinomonas sp. JGH33]MEA5454846.1 hypothetical protein [Sinomonas sp. JGH33]
MAEEPTGRHELDELIAGAAALGALAGNEEVFRAAVDAFRAEDGESMAGLLARHQLAEQCEIICRWLRSKETVLLCLELAGPPTEEVSGDAFGFAQVVAKIAADEELIELLARAVTERSRESWDELVKQADAARFSHELCHWASAVHYRLVCEVVCNPKPVVARQSLVAELGAAGRAIGALAADRELFAEAEKAVIADRCLGLQDVLERAALGPWCRLVCEWFCSWRCFLRCIELCRRFPLAAPESPIGEMLEFARATAALPQAGIERLAAAALRGDAELVGELAKEFGYERFCLQFCHWVCLLRCTRFCFCVCPPRNLGIFTKIGALHYATDVHSAAGNTGLTVADARAFYSTLRLNGGLSLVDGAPLVEYRFETVNTNSDGSTLADGTPILPTSWQPVVPAQIAATEIGVFERPIAGPPFFEEIRVVVNGTNPADYNITPSPDGWIKVPPMFPVPPMVPVPDPNWRFYPGDALINFMTTTLPYTASVDETGVVAGASANAPLMTDVHYGIRMRLRNQGTSGSGAEAGTCPHIAINNTLYNNVSHHPYWPGGLFGASNELAVSDIGIEELRVNPCSTLSDSLTVKFTAAHSHLGSVSAELQGPGGPFAFTLVPDAGSTAGQNLYGNAVPAGGWSFGSLAPCAYLLSLSVEVLLTTGDSVPYPPLTDYIAFCKK